MTGFRAAVASVAFLFVSPMATSGVASADDAQSRLPLAPHGTKFLFEVIESHDAAYLGDTWECGLPCKPRTWHRDADGHGLGDPSAILSACTAPPGYAADSSDCNDADPAIYPSAPEVNDGMDNQCPDDRGYGAINEVSPTATFTGSSFC